MDAAAIPLLDAPRLERYGLPEYLKGTSPAAGAMFSEAIGGTFYSRLISVHVRLVTDANVANRTVCIEYRDDEDARILISGAPVTQAASSTNDWIFSAFQQQAEWEIDGSILVPLAPLLMLPGWDFRVFVDNIQAGDQLSRIRVVREQFYTGGPAPGVRE